ncbi:MAG: DNA-3-methyladenine glycosylase [Nitrososphaerota archaeon]|jgi:DNA-3-methyladenine glycosylase|nr:DNA-3-methyladenine glycosylase [Nitrososphaerota archaeon]MDG6931577.1 DNA-3-methyladenine glycosylase [Nitrososphaerota archaeon]MDG6936005.1 DNA-3-methyladenine glycosylase [Nitrososphaerota archaeon]MDG6943941.1 DNA-3-methyladenine glycosylase [Nitrososphaerota archaeon]
MKSPERLQLKIPRNFTEFKPIDRNFYLRETTEVAEGLLGQLLVRTIGKNLMAVRITEVEAYKGLLDPASHAYRGREGRAKIMFGDVGLAYVYLSYGVHYCLNVVAKSKEQEAGAVLIRSGEPVIGYQFMKMFHNKDKCKISSGPGNLTKSLNIIGAYNGYDLTSGTDLHISQGWLNEGEKIIRSFRVGISKATDKKWRFLIAGNCTVSKKP